MMHLSRMGLIQAGFKEIAVYECFKKGRKKLNIQCWSDGKNFLVRNFHNKGTAWDMVYTNKKEANDRVLYLWSLYSFHKRIR